MNSFFFIKSGKPSSTTINSLPHIASPQRTSASPGKFTWYAHLTYLDLIHSSMSVANLPIYRPQGRGLGVVFENITVYGEADSAHHVTDLQAIMTTAVMAPWNFVYRLLGSKPKATKTIIHDISGVVFPGETMIVLGQPGAGCSTTLKVIANERGSYPAVEGNVAYSSILSDQMPKTYASEVVYNAEDDIHYPRLKVQDTLDFSLRLRRPAHNCDKNSKEFSNEMTDSILESLGMLHTKQTIVGNSFVRGVSGGERKRVSLAEVLAVNPAIACWDNPIRGLDSSSALQFLSVLKQISSATRMSNIVTIYQASESMYQHCFDRVLVLYEGRMAFSGKASDACDYFISLGFHKWDRQTTPDFLTAVTSPSERVVRRDHIGPVPRTPDEFAEAFKKSPYYEALTADILAYHQAAAADASGLDSFYEEARRVRAKYLSISSEPTSIMTQSLAAVSRYYKLLWVGRRDFYLVLFLNAVNAVINGSAYYMAPKTATGSFEKGGAIFFSLIYFFLNALAEVSSTIEARSILIKQHKLGLIHPVAFIIAQTIAELPVAVVQALVFSCCYYFMLGLYKSASDFWIFALILFTHYGAVSSLFRMLGAWAPNLNIALLMAGSAMPICLTYAGYGPQVPTMHRWGSWIRRICPTPYALEALMGNEFSDITLHCTPEQMVPSGPTYNDMRYQGCTITGSVKGSDEVAGSTYLSLIYKFSQSNIWRNLGIILVMWFLYVVLTAIGLTIMTGDGGSAGGHVFKRGAKPGKHQISGFEEKRDDIEDNTTSAMRYVEPVSSNTSITQVDETVAPAMTKEEEEAGSSSNHDAFTFKDISYFVHVDGSEKQLLSNVSGYAKPGQLTALMGASGAGKTTLLDTISQRKDVGRVEGEMLMGGKALGVSFSRSCGFCLQQDIHEPTATVREALEFSARLRQPDTVPISEKLAYVDEIISLLELEPIADAIIGEPGDGGLNIEERKRVTIGVELAAKPSSLLFLDEVSYL
jgi:ATP-binding cassette subfamily G (WHITE) protein 2 (SNQ2)